MRVAILIVCLSFVIAGCGDVKVAVIAPAPRSPVANAGGPYMGTVQTAVSFSGAGSTDPQGQTLTYAWNFGDGTTSTGVSPTHTYTAPGTYTVSLTVTNTSSLTNAAASKATIAAAPPLAYAGGPYSGTPGAAVSFNGAGSTDPQGQTLTYAWSFGDGTTGTGVSPAHTYSAPGAYTVTLTVTDTSSLSNTSGSRVTIAVTPPVANAGGPYTGTVGAAVSFSGAGSTDPLGETLTYAWNFGDGTTGTGVSPTHTYSAPGTYTVSLTVTDTSKLTGTASSNATIAAAPLSDVSLIGSVSSGLRPIAGAHVYLFAASTAGYGQPSASLVSAIETGHADSVGAYVLTGSNGGFSLAGDYTCSSGQQIYLYALGGDSGFGANSASGLLAAIGACPISPSPALVVTVNEVSTIAAAYALAGFATDATHVASSGTALAQVGVANAFANAANLANLSIGNALATTPAGNGTVPQATINTLANILAACVYSAGPGTTGCLTLFANATSGGATGTAATDTATAAINIAHNPGSNIAALYGSPTPTSPYTPTLGAQPNDFTIGLVFPNGGASPGSIAIDASGNAWTANSGTYNSVSKFSSTGTVLSPTGGYTGGGLDNPLSIAIDGSGNVWIPNRGEIRGTTGTVSEFSSTGAALSPSGYSGGGLGTPTAIAIDGQGNIWITNYAGSVSEFSGVGVALSPSTGYTGGGLSGPWGIAVDGSGSAWVANQSGNSDSISKFSGAGVALSPSTGGYFGGGLFGPVFIAIDSSGDAWAANNAGSGSVSKFSNSGTALSPSTGGPSNTGGYTGGGATNPYSIAIDGAGDVWVTNQLGYVVNGTVSEFSSAGTALSPSIGYSSGGVGEDASIAVDGSGDVWIANGNSRSVSELIGAATPVITPICAGLPATPTADGSSKLGTRP